MGNLTITTKQRDTVNIDDHNYELKLADEFSFDYYMKLSAIGKEIQEMDYDKQTDRKKFIRLIDKVISDILIAPGKIQRKLNAMNKIEIINFFLSQQKLRHPPKNTNSSPGSGDSTVALTENG